MTEQFETGDMPQDTRALTRAARVRMRARGEKYTEAREAVLAIRERMDEREETYEEAEAWFDDPASQVMCGTCGWTSGMACPECPGCGCYYGCCSGWRHQEYMHEDELAELREDERCEECGADLSMGSYDECHCG
jgi:hypothetical protein